MPPPQLLLFADSGGGTRRERLHDVLAVRSAGGSAGDLEVQLRPGRGAPVPVRVGDGFDVARLQQLFTALQRRTGSEAAPNARAGPARQAALTESEAAVGRSRPERGALASGVDGTAGGGGGGGGGGGELGRSSLSAELSSGGRPTGGVSPSAAALGEMRRPPPQRDAAWRRQREEMQARLKVALDGRIPPNPRAYLVERLRKHSIASIHFRTVHESHLFPLSIA